MRKFIDIIESAAPSTYYHVTLATRVPAIRREGLRTGQKQNWSNLFGRKLGESKSIYLFSDLREAIRWGARMEWHFKKDIVIIEVRASGVEADNGMGLHAPTGTAWKTHEDILPEDIIGVRSLTLELKQAVAQDLPIEEDWHAPQ